jgi:hypothetical protein
MAVCVDKCISKYECTRWYFNCTFYKHIGQFSPIETFWEAQRVTWSLCLEKFYRWLYSIWTVGKIDIKGI